MKVTFNIDITGCTNYEVHLTKGSDCLLYPCKIDKDGNVTVEIIPGCTEDLCIEGTVICLDGCNSCTRDFKKCLCINGECPDPCETCIDGFCEPLCPVDKVCDDGKCVDCSDGFPCPDGKICTNGRCVCPVDKPYIHPDTGECIECIPGTIQDCLYCNEGEWEPLDCGDGVCDPDTDDCVECINSGDCGPNQVCEGKRCVCAPGYRYDPVLDKCVEIPPCDTDADCDVCEICKNGNCVPLECPPDHVCENGECVYNPCPNQPCTNGTDCGEGCGCNENTGMCEPCINNPCGNDCDELLGCQCVGTTCRDVNDCDTPCSNYEDCINGCGGCDKGICKDCSNYSCETGECGTIPGCGCDDDGNCVQVDPGCQDSLEIKIEGCNLVGELRTDTKCPCHAITAVTELIEVEEIETEESQEIDTGGSDTCTVKVIAPSVTKQGNTIATNAYNFITRKFEGYSKDIENDSKLDKENTNPSSSSKVIRPELEVTATLETEETGNPDEFTATFSVNVTGGDVDSIYVAHVSQSNEVITFTEETEGQDNFRTYNTGVFKRDSSFPNLFKVIVKIDEGDLECSSYSCETVECETAPGCVCYPDEGCVRGVSREYDFPTITNTSVDSYFEQKKTTVPAISEPDNKGGKYKFTVECDTTKEDFTGDIPYGGEVDQDLINEEVKEFIEANCDCAKPTDSQSSPETITGNSYYEFDFKTTLRKGPAESTFLALSLPLLKNVDHPNIIDNDAPTGGSIRIVKTITYEELNENGTLVRTSSGLAPLRTTSEESEETISVADKDTIEFNNIVIEKPGTEVGENIFVKNVKIEILQFSNFIFDNNCTYERPNIIAEYVFDVETDFSELIGSEVAKDRLNKHKLLTSDDSRNPIFTWYKEDNNSFGEDDIFRQVYIPEESRGVYRDVLFGPEQIPDDVRQQVPLVTDQGEIWASYDYLLDVDCTCADVATFDDLQICDIEFEPDINFELTECNRVFNGLKGFTPCPINRDLDDYRTPDYFIPEEVQTYYDLYIDGTKVARFKYDSTVDKLVEEGGTFFSKYVYEKGEGEEPISSVKLIQNHGGECDVEYTFDINIPTPDYEFECNQVETYNATFDIRVNEDYTIDKLQILPGGQEFLPNGSIITARNLEKGVNTSIRVFFENGCNKDIVVQANCCNEASIGLEVSTGIPEGSSVTGTIIPNGLVPPITYYLGSSELNDASFTISDPDTYKFKAIDNTNCEKEITKTFVLLENDITIELERNNVCHDEVTTLTVTGRNGTDFTASSPLGTISGTLTNEDGGPVGTYTKTVGESGTYQITSYGEEFQNLTGPEDTLVVNPEPVLIALSFTSTSSCAGSPTNISLTGTQGTEVTLEILKDTDIIDTITRTIPGDDSDSTDTININYEPTETGDFTVRVKNDGLNLAGCIGNSDLTNSITIKPEIDEPIVVNNDIKFFCKGGPIPSASATKPEYTIKWYSDSDRTNEIGTGVMFTPNSDDFNDNSIFIAYAAAVDNEGCKSPGVEVEWRQISYDVDISIVSGGTTDQDGNIINCQESNLVLEANATNLVNTDLGDISYNWSNGDTGNTITLDPTYSGQISVSTDNEIGSETIEGCINSDVKNILSQVCDECEKATNPINIDRIVVNDVTVTENGLVGNICPGSGNVRVKVYASGGTSPYSVNYSISIMNGPTFSPNTFVNKTNDANGLTSSYGTPGTNFVSGNTITTTVTVTDDMGCSKSITYTMNVLGEQTVDLGNDIHLCYTDLSGNHAEIIPSPATGNWGDFPVGINTSEGTDKRLTILGLDNPPNDGESYTLTYSTSGVEGTSCEDSGSITITYHNPESGLIDTTNLSNLCPDSAPVELSVSGITSNENVTYIINNNDITGSTFNPSNYAAPGDTASVTIGARIKSEGPSTCTRNIDPVTIEINPANCDPCLNNKPTLSILNTSLDVCSDGTFIIEGIDVSGGTPNYDIYIEYDSLNEPQIIKNVSQGNYSSSPITVGTDTTVNVRVIDSNSESMCESYPVTVNLNITQSTQVVFSTPPKYCSDATVGIDLTTIPTNSDSGTFYIGNNEITNPDSFVTTKTETITYVPDEDCIDEGEFVIEYLDVEIIDSSDTLMVDYIFFVDNSSSIVEDEFNNIKQTIGLTIDELDDNANDNRYTIVNYWSQYNGSTVPTTSMIDIVVPFTSEAADAKNFARSNFGLDDLNNCLGLLIDEIGTGISFRAGAQRKMIIFTDARSDSLSEYDNCNSCIFPNTNMNILKGTHNVEVSAVWYLEENDIPDYASIPSVGGTYTGAVTGNPGDPEGSGTTPRRLYTRATDATGSVPGLAEDVSTVKLEVSLPGATYLWSNSSKNRSITVPKGDGVTYTVEVEKDGCSWTLSYTNN